MSADIVTFRASALPAAAQCPGALAVTAREPILPPDAQLRLGMHSATKLLRNFITNPQTDTRRVARLVTTCVVAMAPAEWTVADLVEWLTSAVAQEHE